MTDEHVRRELLASGWQEGDVNEALGKESIHSGLLSATQLFRKALAKLRERYGIAFRIILLPLIAGVLGFILFIYTPDSPALFLLMVLVAIVLFVVSAIFNVVALISFVHLFSKEEILKPSEYIRMGLKKFWSYVWLAVLSSFIVLGGYFLLLVPGIIFSVWFGMAIYVLILEDRKGMEALLRSRHLVLGKFWKTVGRGVFMAIVGIVILIPFWAIDFLVKANLSVLTQIVSYVVVVPLSVSFYVAFFQNLVQLKLEPFVYDKKSARKFIITGLVGILLILSLMAFGGYYYFTKLRPLLQTPVLTPTYDPTANWPVYHNEKYGFKFKYPADFSIEDKDIAPPDQVVLYNYRYDFYPTYRGGYGGLTRYSNFGLSFGAVSANTPQHYSTLGIVKSVANRTIGTNIYAEVDMAGRHETRYLIKDQKGGYAEFAYRPIIDKTDIGGLTNEPDYVAGVDVVRKNPSFLDENQQRIILDQILSTFKFIEPVNSYSQQQKEIVEADVKKVADFAQFRVMAELYYEKYKKYPKAEGNTPEARWQSFSTAVVNEGLFPKELPQDPRQKVKGFSYDCQTDPSRQSAVFKAILEAPDDEDVKLAITVNHDVDGVIYGIDCNKPNYCLRIPK